MQRQSAEGRPYRMGRPKGRTLVNQITSRMGTLEESAVATMAAELEFIRAHKDLLETILSFEGKYDATSLIEASLDCGLKLVEVSTAALSADNQFAFECLCTAYEAEKFDQLLVAADYANYFAALRVHYGCGAEYGRAEEWIVWHRASGLLLKTRFLGPLSALHQGLPDEATHQLMVDAGIDVATAIRPLFILRASALRRRSNEDEVQPQAD